MRNKPEYISLFQFFKRFPDENKAVEYVELLRWPSGATCPRCHSAKRVKEQKSQNPMKWYCGDCRKYFSVKISTVMQEAKLPVQKWLLIAYLMQNAKKGVSSLHIHRELGISQKTAWFALQRIREAYNAGHGQLFGIVEVDETYIGGKERNKHRNKRLKVGRGAVGKQPVLGMRQRDGNIKASVIPNTSASTLQTAILQNVRAGSTVYTDEHRGYIGLANKGYKHEVVKP